MKKNTFYALIGVGALLAAPVFGQEIAVDTVSGTPGDTVSVDVNFTAGGDVASVQFDLMYNVGDFNANVTECGGVADTGACNDTVDGTVSVAATNISDPLVSGVIATIDFTIDAAATADNVERPFTVTNVVCSDTMLNPVTCTVTEEGGIIVAAGPTLDANPASDTINTGNTSSGMASSTFTASGGSVGNISCAAAGPDSEISFSASPPATLADGASFDVTATCSSAATGTFNNSYSCTSDASNSPTSFDVTCNVTMDAANVSSNPPSGSSVVIGPLVPGAGGSTQITFNNAGGTDATVNSCSLATGTDFSLGTVPATVPAGGSASLTVSGTAPQDGSSPTDTLTCDIDGEIFTFSVGILLQPLVVPTMTQWGLILMALGLFGFGFWTLRRRGDFTA